MSGARAPALEVRDLVVAYGERVAVDRVSLELPPGGLTVVVGPSGCGKTSLLRAVAGFETPRAGVVRIAGVTVFDAGGAGASPVRLPPERRCVGMVFQQGALFPHMTVDENVRYGLRGRDDVEERARRALELIGLAACGDRFPDQLSGGEQQRVALARALAPAPRLLLLDEPFASLDAGLRRRLRGEVRSILEAAAMTSVLVTHDLEEALSLADTVVAMSAGRVLQVDPPERLYRQPASLEVARLLGDGQLLSCRVADGRAESLLGTVPCPGAAAGPGLLLVRPEDLEPAGDEVAERASGVAGVLCGRTFYGHDRVDEVRLEAGGAIVQVRGIGAGAAARGTRVRLRLRSGPFVVFPDPEPARGATIVPLETAGRTSR